MTPEQLEKMQMFRETGDQLRLSAEQSLGKILDKGQVGRLKQIQLQLDGPWVVLRDDMVEKLNMTEEQVQMLTELRTGQNQKQRELRKAGRDAFDAAMKQANPDFQGFGGRGNRGGNRGNGANNNGGQGGNNNGGQGGNNNGGQGGGGAGQNGNQGGRPPIDPAAFQRMQEEFRAAMDKPEVKAQREKQQEAEKSLEDETYALISKNLYPRQRATLKKMVGAPFDRSVMGGPFAGRFGGGAVAKNGTTKGQTAAKSNSEDDEDEKPAATAKPAAPAKAKASAPAPRKNSLRALRGEDDE
jgi:hypothetical protein